MGVSLICKCWPGTETLPARRQGLIASKHTSICDWLWSLCFFSSSLFWYKEIETAKDNRWAARRITWPVSYHQPKETRFYFWALQIVSLITNLLFFFRRWEVLALHLVCKSQWSFMVQHTCHTIWETSLIFLSEGRAPSTLPSGLPLWPSARWLAWQVLSVSFSSPLNCQSPTGTFFGSAAPSWK